MAESVTISLEWKNDPDFPREVIEVWRVLEEGESLATFDSREEAESYAKEYCGNSGATFDEENSD